MCEFIIKTLAPHIPTLLGVLFGGFLGFVGTLIVMWNNNKKFMREKQLEFMRWDIESRDRSISELDEILERQYEKLTPDEIVDMVKIHISNVPEEYRKVINEFKSKNVDVDEIDFNKGLKDLTKIITDIYYQKVNDRYECYKIYRKLLKIGDKKKT